MADEEAEFQGKRNIISRWLELTPADVAEIRAAIAERSRTTPTTVRDCAHGYFWGQVRELGWAYETAAPAVMTTVPSIVCYRPNPDGRRALAQFIATDRRRPRPIRAT